MTTVGFSDIIVEVYCVFFMNIDGYLCPIIVHFSLYEFLSDTIKLLMYGRLVDLIFF